MMPMMLRGGESPSSLFIAVPEYGGICGAFATALFDTAQRLERDGVKATIRVFSGNCHVDDSRNSLVRDFLDSNCDTFVFLDADICWKADDFMELYHAPYDVAAGVYPLKQDAEGYPVFPLPGEIWADENGFVEVIAAPTGFLKISRAVLEKLASLSPTYAAKSDKPDQGRIPLIFERAIHDGMRWGGDYNFCLKARAAGFHIHCNPTWTFQHFGEEVWSGNLGDFWRRTLGGNERVLVEGFDRLRQGDDQALNNIVHAWSSEWAAPPTMLSVLSMLEFNGPVLECGSGLSTLVLAISGAEVHALEHSPVWASEFERWSQAYLTPEERARVHLHFAPLQDYGDCSWYSMDGIPDQLGGIVCDGPPRKTKGGRKGVEMVLDRLSGPFILDDANGYADWIKSLPFSDIRSIDRRVVIAYGNSTERH